jgi:hypothetical protein
MSMKLKVLKDHCGKKPGELYDEPDAVRAKWWIDNGFCEEKKAVPQKDKMIKGSKNKGTPVSSKDTVEK